MKTYDQLSVEEKHKLLEQYEKQKAYRAAYNATHKEEQKAYRRQYNKNRWALLKAVKAELENN